MSEWAAGSAIIAVAAGAVWFDVKERRIPNVLTVTAFAVALMLGLAGGVAELGASLAGAGICFLLSVPFFLVRGLGGGDVKLLTAFGAFLGPTRLGSALVAMALVGGAMGFVAMVRKGAVRRTFSNLYLMLATASGKALGRADQDSAHWMTLDTPGAVTVPYGVAISAGAVFAWFF